MRRIRIYTDQPLQAPAQVELHDDTAHYVGKVLRLRIGDPLFVFNGDGYEYDGYVEDMSKKSVLLTLEKQLSPQTESRLHTILGLGISRGERMDFAIQKSTELGVNVIVPLFTDHCEVKLAAERLDRRQQHWQQIAISACEQSGRVKIPIVAKPLVLDDWLKTVQAERKFLFDLSQQHILGGTRPEGGVALLIGPEGGLSANEQTLALREGFTGIALGGRVLRTETAPVAALSVLQYLWGS
jgi:16S rRNA (uracil1498-N3)-methyltransferase